MENEGRLDTNQRVGAVIFGSLTVFVCGMLAISAVSVVGEGITGKPHFVK